MHLLTREQMDIFVSKTFADQLINKTQIEQLRGFKPHTVEGYDGQHSGTINLCLRGTLQVQNRILPDEVMMVIKSGHDLILGNTECKDIGCW